MASPRIAGRYRLLERISSAGAGHLWAARDERSGLPVAVRVLTRGIDDPQRVAHFRASARAAARLDHPHVARLLDEGQDEDGPFIVTEWIDGDPLGAWCGEPRPWGFVREVALQMVGALAQVHAAGLVHLDLRPGNIIVAQGEDAPFVRLVEVGCARIDDGWSDRPSDARQTHKMLGSLRYMPPEVADSPPWRFGPWSDLYTVGLIVWELLTGELPMTADSAVSLLMLRASAPAPLLPPGVGGEHEATLRALLDRLLARRPEDRPRTAAQVRGTLESMAAPPRWVPPPAGKARYRQPAFDANRARTAGFPLATFPPGPLVGREGVLEALRGALREVVSGYGSRVVALEGAVGVGKTRLVEEVMREAEEMGAARAWRVGFHAGSPPGSGLAGAIEDLLRAGVTDADGIRARAESLPLLLGIDPHGLDVVLPAVLRPAPATLGEEPSAARHVDDPSTLSLVPNAFFEMLRRTAANEAIVLALDDAQWATPGEGSDLVRRIVARADLAVLVVITNATEQPGARVLRAALADLPVTWLAIEPLEGDAIRGYVRRRLGLARGDEDRVVHAAGAHPILLRGVVDQLLAGGLLARAGGMGLGEGALPAEDLRELFGRAVGRLPTQGPDTLVPDVVLGLAHARLPLGPEVIAALELAHPDRPWQRALAAAERERLMVRSPLGRWRFVHRMLSDWLMLNGRDGAASWHRRWLDALERLEADDRGRLGPERAAHHEALDEHRAAAEALMTCAARALGPGQPLSERALAAAERAVTVAEGLRSPRILARALRIRAALMRRAGRMEVARQLVDGAEAWLLTPGGPADPAELARCELLRAWLSLDAGDPRAAIAHVESARARDNTGAHWTAIAMGTAGRVQGQHRVSRTFGRQAEEGFAAAHDARGLWSARRLRAAAADDARDFPAAERRYARLQADADARRWLPDLVLLRLDRARVALETGQVEVALAQLESARPIADAAGLDGARAWIDAVGPAALAAAGRHAEARDALRSARAPERTACARAADAVAAGARHARAALDPPLRDALVEWAERLRAAAGAVRP